MSANDEWQLQHRYMQIEGMAGFTPSCSTTPSQQFTSGRLTDGRSNSTPNFHLIDGHDPFRPREGLALIVSLSYGRDERS